MAVCRLDQLKQADHMGAEVVEVLEQVDLLPAAQAPQA